MGEAILPEQDAGNVIQFKITVTLGNGEEVYFPRNPASPEYETFVGEVVPLYCTDFELDPELDGWSTSCFGAMRGDLGATIGNGERLLESKEVVTHHERILDDGLSETTSVARSTARTTMARIAATSQT